MTPESAPTPLLRERTTENRLTFTTTQAARYLGVSLGTVRRWADAGHVQCYRTPGGQRRFSRGQLDSFIASLQGGGPQQAPRALAG